MYNKSIWILMHAKESQFHKCRQCPMQVCLGNPPMPFCHLGFPQTNGEWAKRLHNAPCALVVCSWFPSLKPTTNIFSWEDMYDLAWKCLLFTSWARQNWGSLGVQGLRAVSETAQNKHLGASSGKTMSTERRQASPNAGLLCKATLAFFPSRTLPDLGQRGQAVAQRNLCTGCGQMVHLLETHSKRILLSEVGFGLKKPSFHKPGKVAHCEAGVNNAWVHGNKLQKTSNLEPLWGKSSST